MGRGFGDVARECEGDVAAREVVPVGREHVGSREGEDAGYRPPTRRP